MESAKNLPIFEYDICTSTNLLARDWSKINPGKSAIFFSKAQTNGRGQQGKTWSSNTDEGWYFSICLANLNLAINQSPQLNWSVCLALIKFFQQIGINASIKWPNDIYTQNGKIAGILIENLIQNQTLKSSIIGIGINLKTPDIPVTPLGVSSITEILPNFSPESLSKQNIFQEISIEIKNNLTRSKSALLYDLNQKLFGANKYFNFTLGSDKMDAKVTAVNTNGNLVLLNEHKEIEAFSGNLIWNYEC